MAVLTLLAAYPELYAGYEAERLTKVDEKTEAEQYHLMSAIIRVSRTVRLVEIVVVVILSSYSNTN